MARERGYAYVPSLPNKDSTGQTPSSLYIDCHYANLLLVETWTHPRFVRLCQLLKMTPCEVASLVMMPHRVLPAFERENILKCQGARPITLLLTIIENQLLSSSLADSIPNPFPDLSKIGTHSY